MRFIWALFVLSLFGSAQADEQRPIMLPPISVTPEGFGIQEGAHGLRKLSRQQMEMLPLIDNDVARAAQIFPGVVSTDFSARFEVRGGDKDETLVRLDGLELYNPWHLQDYGGAISSLDLGLVSSAELLTGGFPAVYGDRLSAVYEIRSRTPKRDRVHVNLGVDLMNMHAILEGPLGNGAWLLAARRGYIDLILALMGSDVKYNPRYTDLFLKVEQPISDRDTLTFESLMAWDENEIHEPPTDLRSHYRNRIAWLRWQRLWSKWTSSDLFLFVGDYDQEKREGDWFGEPDPAIPLSSLVGERDERRFNYLGWQADLNAAVNNTHKIRLGARWLLADVFYDYFFREEEGTPIQARIDPENWDWDARAYLQDEWQISSSLALNCGIRWIYQHEFHQTSWSPRVALAFRPTERWILRTAWGIYYQPVDRLHIPVESGQMDVTRPEETQHWIVSLEYRPQDSTFFRWEAYYKPMKHLVGFIRDAGRKNQLFVVPDSGKAWGSEFFVAHTFSDRLSGSFAYAYAVTQASIGDQTFPKDNDQRHTALLILRYLLSDSLALVANWRWHTGGPYTESRFVYDEATQSWRRINLKLNARRLPPYHSLDVRLTKQARYRSWNLQWYLQVLNLYNRKNVHEVVYQKVLDKQGRVIGYKTSQERLLPIILTMGLTVRF